MEWAERNCLYRAAFFGTVAVAVPYLMRVGAVGRHALNPVRLGPLTLLGSIKPMTVSLLSGLVALHYLFKKPPSEPDRSGEEQLRGELQEAALQLEQALSEIKGLPEQVDKPEEGRVQRAIARTAMALSQLGEQLSRVQQQEEVYKGQNSLKETREESLGLKLRKFSRIQQRLQELASTIEAMGRKNKDLSDELAVVKRATPWQANCTRLKRSSGTIKADARQTFLTAAL